MPKPEPLGKKVGTVERQPAKNMPYTCGKYNFITEFSVGRYNMPSFEPRPDVHHDFGTLKPRYSGALFLAVQTGDLTYALYGQARNKRFALLTK